MAEIVISGMSLAELDRAADEFAALVDAGIEKVTQEVLEKIENSRPIVAAAEDIDPEELPGEGAEDAEGVDPTDADFTFALWAAYVSSVLIPFLAQSMNNANREQADAFIAGLGVDPPFINEPVSTERYLNEARNRLVGIGNELWFNIRTAIIEGLNAGEPFNTIAGRIREAAPVTIPRANTIARTESNSARNTVAMSTVRKVNMAFGATTGAIRKRWQATGDDRTRDTHRRADGQEVELNEPFRVGNASLDHPSDSSGPADEVINCRCVALTIINTDMLDLENSSDTITLNASTFQEDDDMPWSIEQNHSECDSGQWAVVKDSDGSVAGCHDTEEEAQAQITALNIAEADESDKPVTAASSRHKFVPWSGVIVTEGSPTGDGRQFELGALEWPEVGAGASLEIPLGWMYERAHGGLATDKVANIGRIDTLERRGNDIYATGGIDANNEFGRRALAQMGTRENPGYLAGVSIDPDDPKDPTGRTVEYVFPTECALNMDEDSEETFDPACMVPELAIYKSGRIRALTLVDIPAFVEGRIYLDQEPDAVAIDPEDSTEVVTASAGATYTITLPEIPPAEWFLEPADDPDIGAITVTDEGRIFGYLAPKGVAHRGIRDKRVEVPTRNVDYGIWMNRATIVENNGAFEKIRTGPITMDCGHAPTDRRMVGAARQEHYDNSCSIVATACVGENAHGVWIAGAVLPDVTADQIRRMMALQLSGDWGPHREKPGKRELAGALLVPVPGFPRRAYQRVMVERGELQRTTVPLRFATVEYTEKPETFGLKAAVNKIAETVGRDRKTKLGEFARTIRKE